MNFLVSFFQWKIKLFGHIINEGFNFYSLFLYYKAKADKDWKVLPSPMSSHNAPDKLYLNKKLTHLIPSY